MNKSKKTEKNIRDSVIAGVSIVLILCGLIGLHYDDWTSKVLIIPFGWGIIGLLLNMAINGKTSSSRSTIGIAVCGTLIIFNVGVIFVHRDTTFLIGRLLCIIGATLLIIRSAANIEETAQEELDKLNEKFKKREG